MEMMPTAIKVAASAVDAVRRPLDGLVVLIYHRIGGRTPVRVDLPTPTFDAQMEFLSESGGVLSIDDARDRLAAGEGLSGHSVGTVDDGTAGFVDKAMPVLVRHQIPATLYVATRHVDEGAPFSDDGQPASWLGLSAALATGFVTVGSRTHSHALLDRLPTREVNDELDRSIGLIHDRLGVAAEHFAYPKALTPTPIAERAVRERFSSAALAGTRANPPGTDVYRLARSPLQTTDSSRWFRRKLDGGMGFEDDLRRLVNRRRYAGASS